MASNSRLQLHAALDNLQEHLVLGQAKTHLAMAALADAAKQIPLLAQGLEPLMTLEADLAGRLALLEAVREDVDGLCDDSDIGEMRKRIAFLSMPGVLTAPTPPSSRLN